MTLFSSFFNATPSDGPVAEALDAARTVQTEGPWQPLPAQAAEGLIAVGFARTSEVLLVISVKGQDVIDATTGACLYRNEDNNGLDVAALKGTRLDHPAEERFDMAGLYGGALKSVTTDGWTTDVIGRKTRAMCILQPPGASIYNLRAAGSAPGLDPTFHLLAAEDDRICAFGFSWSGTVLALATPSSLRLWTRPAPLQLV